MQRRLKVSEGGEAFSLIECLIVIALIVTLVLFLFPAYQRAKIQSAGVINLANHRTIAGGLLAYASEHGSTLPWSNDLTINAMTNAYSKTLCVKGYISDGRVFFNEKFWSRRGDKENAMVVINNPAKFVNAVHPWAYSTYGVNRYGAMPNSSDGRKPANLAKVAGDGNLSRLMLTRDVYQASNDTPSNRLGGGTYWFSGPGFLPEEDDTYNGIVHASFADGHVQGFQRSELARTLQDATKAPIFHDVYTK